MKKIEATDRYHELSSQQKCKKLTIDARTYIEESTR